MLGNMVILTDTGVHRPCLLEMVSWTATVLIRYVLTGVSQVLLGELAHRWHRRARFIHLP